MAITSGSKYTAFAPASVANIGPCYDIMGYCLSHVGDYAELTITDRPGEIEFEGVEGPYASSLKDVPASKNAAYTVARTLVANYAKGFAKKHGIAITLHKYLPICSGLGSSAASGVAVGAILKYLFHVPIESAENRREFLERLSVSEGETAHARHLDNVAPSFLGGFTLHYDQEIVKVGNPQFYSVIVKPRTAAVETLKARTALTKYLERNYLREGLPERSLEISKLCSDQAARAARMALAICTKDVGAIGDVLSDNPLLEGARKGKIPKFNQIKTAARESGALGCSISGSGPSVVAICNDSSHAKRIRDAMRAVAGEDSLWLISPINQTGAGIITLSIPEHAAEGKSYHNFWS